MSKHLIAKSIYDHIAVATDLLNINTILDNIIELDKKIKESIILGGKLVLFGNGGSASDALHIAGEFVGRFKKDRVALPAITLNSELSTITSISNDYSYSQIFDRQVEALVSSNDIVIGITTSGNSINVINGLITAKNIGAYTVAFTGKQGGEVIRKCDLSIMVNSNNTARIQEMHILIGHIICELIDEEY